MDRDQRRQQIRAAVKKSGVKHAPMALEAIDRMGAQLGRVYLLEDMAGFSTATLHYALAYLRDTELVTRKGYFLTTRGHIALAIWRGKQIAIAAKRKLAA